MKFFKQTRWHTAGIDGYASSITHVLYMLAQFNSNQFYIHCTTRLVAEVVKITFHVYAGTIGTNQLERLKLITTTGTRQPICQHVPVSMT